MEEGGSDQAPLGFKETWPRRGIAHYSELKSSGGRDSATSETGEFDHSRRQEVSPYNTNQLLGNSEFSHPSALSGVQFRHFVFVARRLHD